MSVDSFFLTDVTAQEWQPTTLDDLLRCHDRDFIESAYKLILMRSADPDGFQFYLARLRSGVKKLQIVMELSKSDEALARGHELEVLRSHLRRYRLICVPLLGPIFSLFLGIQIKSQDASRRDAEPLEVVNRADNGSAASTPAHVTEVQDVQTLLLYQGADFVEAAYLALLKRAPEPTGLGYYLSRLRDGEQKLQILREVGSSPEARKAGVELPGLRSAIGWQRLSKVPLLGGLIRSIFRLEGDSVSEIRSRAAEQEVSVLKTALSQITQRQGQLEAQLPSMRQTLANLSESRLTFEREELPRLLQPLADVNLRLLEVESEQLPTLFRRLSELHRRTLDIEGQHLPTLLQTLSELNGRQRAFETQQLPTLLQTLSELNHRQLSSDNARDNLVKSVPVALRRITRDVIEMRAHQENTSNATDQRFTETRDLICRAQELIEQRAGVIRNELEGSLSPIRQHIVEMRAHQENTSNATDQRFNEARDQICRAQELIEQRAGVIRDEHEGSLTPIRQHIVEMRERFEKTLSLLEQRIAVTQDHLARTSTSTQQRFEESLEQLVNASTSIEQRFAETRDQIESAKQQTDQRVSEVRDQVESQSGPIGQRIIGIRNEMDGALRDVRYLLGRVEFIRRELMFEMKYGNAEPTGAPERLHVESKIISPDKLDAARKFGIRLNLGCGHIGREGYLNVDRRVLPGVDIVAEVDDLPFSAGQVAEIYSAHLIEHFPQEQLRRDLLDYWRRLLRPGGDFRVVAPDAEAMMKAYFRGEYPFERLREVTFGGQDYNGDFHYNMLNTKSLSNLLVAAGFVDVRVIAENRENGGCKEFEIAARRPEGE